MLTIHVHTNARDAVAYHDDHLRGATAGDYYSQGDPALGMFFGKGIGKLGASDLPYSKEAFARLCSNRHPLTGEQLTVRRKDGARAAYDCTLSAPKSVSVMSLVMDDRRILDAHRTAVAETLELLESRAMTRIRCQGQSDDRATGNLVGVAFEHLTSRAGDPNCHQHCLVFNATFDPSEQRWKALQSSGLYQASALATEVYRSTLVSKLRDIGYETRDTAKGFEIAGVPQEVIDIYSKRRRQIEAIAETLGQTSNPKARAAIARNSRAPKDESVSVEKMREDWLKQLTEEQKQILQRVKAEACRPLVRRLTSAAEAVSWAKEHLFERKSVVRTDELAREALRYARGDNTLAVIHEEIRRRLDEKELLGKDDKVTTSQALRDEEELLEMATDGVGACVRFSNTFIPSPKLNDEQRQVVTETLASTSLLTAVIGPAGSGKSTLLKSVVRGVRSGGNNPVLLAPSGSAVDVLRKDGFVSPDTLQRFLLDKKMQGDVTNGVVILDESSMVSLSQMLSLTKVCKANNTRLILVGDSRQMHSVEAGDAFRLLLSQTLIPRASLGTIIRQKHEGYRKAVSLLKDGEAVRAFDTLDRIGWVHERSRGTGEERALQLAEAFSEAVMRGRSALAVAHTWREASVVTEQVRHVLRTKEVLSATEERLCVLVPRHDTHAERAVAQQLDQGCVLVFRRKTTHFERGEEVRVVETNGKSAIVVRKDGTRVKLAPKKLASHFNVFTEQEIAVARGDKLLLRAKGTSESLDEFANGEIVTVKQVKNGRITLTDGRVIPPSYRHFTHGYCTSVEASQGKTVDNVFLSIDAQSAHNAASLEGFYVAASRGRQSCTIFTDGKMELREAIQNSRAREAATELLREKSYANRKQKRVPLPDSRQVAHSPWSHPIHRYTIGRIRADSVERGGDEYRRETGIAGAVLVAATRTTHRRRGGLADG